MDSQTQVDLSSLSDADKKELNTVLTNEAQKSSIQQGMCLYRSTAICFCNLNDLMYTDSTHQPFTP